MPIINTVNRRNVFLIVQEWSSSISNRFYLPWVIIAILLLAAPAASYGMTIVSLTFDDANADQLVAKPMLAAHGMHGTFYIPSGRVGTTTFLTWSDLLGLQSAGHEVGGHTIDHVHLTTLSAAGQQHEICDDRTALLTNGLAATDLAYPFGDSNSTTETIVAGCGYTSARDVGGVVSPDGCSSCAFAERIPPRDPFLLRTFDSVIDTFTLADLEKAVTAAEAHGGGWLIFIFHHVCSSCNTYEIDPTTLDAFLAWLAPRAATGTIVRTVREVMEDTLPQPSAGTNLLQNPSLETDANKDGVPDCWRPTGFGTSTSQFARTNDAFNGSFAENLKVTSYTSGARRLVSTQDSGTCAPPGIPGHSYNASAWYKGTGPRLSAWVRSSSGSWVWLADSPIFPTSTTWQQAHLTTPAIPTGSTNLSVGLGLYSTGSVTMDSFSLSDASTVPLDVVQPSVSLTSPAAGATVHGTVTLAANASDADGIGDVEFHVNGTAVGVVSRSPYTMPWNSTSVANGPAIIEAIAADNAGNKATAALSVVVKN